MPIKAGRPADEATHPGRWAGGVIAERFNIIHDIEKPFIWDQIVKSSAAWCIFKRQVDT